MGARLLWECTPSRCLHMGKYLFINPSAIENTVQCCMARLVTGRYVFKACLYILAQRFVLTKILLHKLEATMGYHSDLLLLFSLIQ